MPKYLVLIYGDEKRWDEMSADEMQQVDEGHRSFQAKAGAGVVASGQVDTAAGAVTLRVGARGGRGVTDGPFLETKEVLGGFYVVEAANRDEVVTLASGLAETGHDHSGVEIVALVQPA